MPMHHGHVPIHVWTISIGTCTVAPSGFPQWLCQPKNQKKHEKKSFQSSTDSTPLLGTVLLWCVYAHHVHLNKFNSSMFTDLKYTCTKFIHHRVLLCALHNPQSAREGCAHSFFFFPPFSLFFFFLIIVFWLMLHVPCAGYMYCNFVVPTNPLIYLLVLPPIEPSGATHDDSCVLLLE